MSAAENAAGEERKAEVPPLVTAEGAELPEGGEVFWFEGHDGVRLRGAVWPAHGPARGTVVLLHGRTEFIEKYYEVIEELRARGFAVATMDWRGQGLSARETANRLLGHVAHFTDYERDLAAFLKLLAARGLPQPFIVVAHSMGGNIALRWLNRQERGDAMARGLPRIAAAVLSAPMLSLKLPLPKYLAMRALGFIADALGLGARYLPGGSDAQATGAEPFEENVVTSDRARHGRVAALVAAAPDLALAAPSLSWGAAAAESIDDVTRAGFPEAIRVPVLIVGAGRDVLVDTAMMPGYARRLPAGRYLGCDEARHEILMERDPIRAEFWAGFDALADEVAPRHAQPGQAQTGQASTGG